VFDFRMGSISKVGRVTGGSSLLEPERVRSFRPSVTASSFKLNLTSRETEVLQLIADGFLNKQIAQRLYVSPETVESCIGNIRFKLDARNRTHAASIGLREGLIN
jgi:DNA-binding NarL/FixJ family response regulator